MQVNRFAKGKNHITSRIQMYLVYCYKKGPPYKVTF